MQCNVVMPKMCTDFKMIHNNIALPWVLCGNWEDGICGRSEARNGLQRACSPHYTYTQGRWNWGYAPFPIKFRINIAMVCLRLQPHKVFKYCPLPPHTQTVQSLGFKLAISEKSKRCWRPFLRPDQCNLQVHKLFKYCLLWI